MPILLKIQVERTAKTPVTPVAPVSAVCAAFAAQPSAYPPEATKPDVAPVCGSFTGTAGTEGNRLQAACSGGRSRKRRAGERPDAFLRPAGHFCPQCGQFRGMKMAFFCGCQKWNGAVIS